MHIFDDDLVPRVGVVSDPGDKWSAFGADRKRWIIRKRTGIANATSSDVSDGRSVLPVIFPRNCRYTSSK